MANPLVWAPLIGADRYRRLREEAGTLPVAGALLLALFALDSEDAGPVAAQAMERVMAGMTAK